MNRDIINLAFLGVHQSGAASSAREVDRVIAGIEDRRGGDDGNGLEDDFAMFSHGALPGSQAGARSVSQPPDAWRTALVGGAVNLRSYSENCNQMSGNEHYNLNMTTGH